MKAPKSGDTLSSDIHLVYRDGFSPAHLVPSDKPGERGSILGFKGQQVDDGMVAAYKRAEDNGKRLDGESSGGRGSRRGQGDGGRGGGAPAASTGGGPGDGVGVATSDDDGTAADPAS